MKKTFTLFVLACLHVIVFAQQNYQWTWMTGDNTVNQPGIYGSKQTPSSSTKPGALKGATTWTETDGTLWMYGGQGCDETGTLGYLTAMWMYKPTTNLWTWVSGNKQAVALSGEPVYGMKGIPASFTNPGDRAGQATWIDKHKNLWPYGGRSLDGRFLYNGLWQYNITTKMWTWVSGDNTPSVFFTPFHRPVFGTKGEPAPENKPGPRSSATAWTDKDGNFWIFGGLGWSPSGSFGDLNDLWKYNPITKMWAWMHGGSGTFHYSINSPGGRLSSTGTTDTDGNLWLFGGFGAGHAIFQRQLDDLWKFNPTTNAWSWVSGDNLKYTGSDAGQLENIQKAIYGTKGEAAPLNKPGAMYSTLSSDKNGHLWLLGNGELWKFNPTADMWTWVDSFGVASKGSYGTKGIPATTNKPGTRLASMIWTDPGNAVWLMGGMNFTTAGTSEYFNDLWKLSIITPAITLSCTSSKSVSTNANSCAVNVNGIDPVIQPSGTIAQIQYTLSGATTGSGTGSASGKSFNKGITTVKYTLASTSQTCSFTVTVNDAQTPVLTNINASETMLWPANHKMRDIKLHYTSSDNCGVARTEVSVSSNEPQNGLGDGDTPNDWEIISKNHIRLRAERSGKGNGRTYTILVKVWDQDGNMTSKTTAVSVPKNMSGPKQAKTISNEHTQTDSEVIDQWQVTAVPNISSSYFTLMIQSPVSTPITISVLDDKGRLLETKSNKPANGTYTLGNNYKPGMYYAEITQGTEKKVVQLIKQ